jgi:carboxyl-terminal processing protease
VSKSISSFTKNISVKVRKNKKSIVQISSIIAVAVIFLGLGIAIGDGRIQFEKNGKLIGFGDSNVNGLSASINYNDLQQEYNILKQNFDGNLTSKKLQDGAMAGLTQATGDQFTDYFNADQSKAFTNQLNNTFSGIGAELGKNSKGQPIVISPLIGYPAEKAGIKAKDVIVSINGKLTSGLSIDAAVNDIRGPNGSNVTLLVQRGDQDLTFKITRQQITAPSVNHSVINGNIGYIQIISFANDTPNLAQAAATDLKSKGVKYIILDLRDNPGGLVTSAISVSSLWLPQGQTIMIEKHNNQVVQTYTATGNNTLNGIPTVVLINGGSASASEITAAALHDNKAASLIGEKSYGKGTEQQIIPLSNGGEVKVTIAHWYTPNNQTIEYKGIKPDTTVTQNSTDQANNIDTQKNAAIQYLQSH